MEREFVEHLRVSLPMHPQLLLGVGDDAAVLRLTQRSDCVVTSDLLADSTHFNLGKDDLSHIGRKALAVNLSDLAAMAARPLAAVVSLLLPAADALATARGLYEGLARGQGARIRTGQSRHQIGHEREFVIMLQRNRTVTLQADAQDRMEIQI